MLLLTSLRLIVWLAGGVAKRTATTRKTRQETQPYLVRHNLIDNTAMAVLSFSLTPEATGRVYEALVCLAKFGESVAIEARGDKVGFGPDQEHSCRAIT